MRAGDGTVVGRILATQVAVHRGLTFAEAVELAAAACPACPDCNGEPRTVATRCMTCAAGAYHGGIPSPPCRDCPPSGICSGRCFQ